MSGNKFNYIKRGYDPQEVDDYIDAMERVLKSYKEKDMAIKNAIVNAQIAADSIIKNAEIQANEAKSNVISQMSSFAETISFQKSLIKEFQEDYAYLVQKYVQDYNETDFTKLYEKLNQVEKYFDDLNSPAYTSSTLDMSNLGEDAEKEHENHLL